MESRYNQTQKTIFNWNVVPQEIVLFHNRKKLVDILVGKVPSFYSWKILLKLFNNLAIFIIENSNQNRWYQSRLNKNAILPFCVFHWNSKLWNLTIGHQTVFGMVLLEFFKKWVTKIVWILEKLAKRIDKKRGQKQLQYHIFWSSTCEKCIILQWLRSCHA